MSAKTRSITTPAAVALTVAALLVLIVTLTHVVKTYNAPGNAGVIVGSLVGIEWRGTPGPFLCTDQC